MAVAHSRKGLWVSLALIAGGVVLFFVQLGLRGVDPDRQGLGLLDWVLAGVLIGPGFASLIRWRAAKDAARR